MEFGSERSGHEVKDEKRSESSVGDEEDRREQEIITQVKINIKHTMMSFKVHKISISFFLYIELIPDFVSIYGVCDLLISQKV